MNVVAKSEGILELSRKQAERYAFRLIAYSSAIFPEKNKKIGNVIAPHGIFKDNENTIFLHFIYETDKFQETYVDVFGLAWSYVSASTTSNYSAEIR